MRDDGVTDGLCWKCRDRQGYNITLTGDYDCVLCLSCRNNWHVYLHIENSNQNKDFSKYHKLKVMVTAIDPKSGSHSIEQMIDISKQFINIELKLFRYAKQWVEEIEEKG